MNHKTINAMCESFNIVTLKLDEKVFIPSSIFVTTTSMSVQCNVFLALCAQVLGDRN